jgi:PIN domain nuclease of toxin-antitoxin system
LACHDGLSMMAITMKLICTSRMLFGFHQHPWDICVLNRLHSKHTTQIMDSGK